MIVNPTKNNDSFIVGIVCMLLLNFYLCLFLVPLMFVVGILQLVYVIPWCMRLKRKGKKEMFKGVITGAVITFLLNSTCYGLLFWLAMGLSNMHS